MAKSQKQLCEELIWVERNGNRLHISEMKDSHIQNAIRAIEEGRIKAERKGWVPVLKQELKKRSLRKKINNL